MSPKDVSEAGLWAALSEGASPEDMAEAVLLAKALPPLLLLGLRPPHSHPLSAVSVTLPTPPSLNASS